MMTALVNRTEFSSVKENLMMRSLLSVSIALSIGLSSTLMAETLGKLARYPGSPDMRSPTGQYVVSSIDDEKLEPAHALVVRNTRTREEKLRIPYARYVEVAWSPDGNSLAVNDHGGSNSTNCKIVALGEKIRSIEVTEQLREKINPPSITRNHHVFLECVEWFGNNKVMIKTHGYGDLDPKGFSESYVFHLEEGFFETNTRNAR